MSTTEFLELTPLQSSPLAGASTQARQAIPSSTLRLTSVSSFDACPTIVMGLVFLWAIPNLTIGSEVLN